MVMHHQNSSNNNMMMTSNGEKSINVRLEDRDLWLRFYEKTNEMIVTRSGRYVLM
jgi:hypothetical protein